MMGQQNDRPTPTATQAVKIQFIKQCLLNLAGALPLHPLELALFIITIKKCPLEFIQKMSMKIHPKRGLLVDKSVHEKSPKGVHEKSPILKKSVHEMSLSTKCLHPDR